MRVSAKLLKVPEAASFMPCAPAHSLTSRTREEKRGSMSARYRRTVDLNLAAPLATLMSHSMPAQWRDPAGVSNHSLGRAMYKLHALPKHQRYTHTMEECSQDSVAKV